MPISFTDAFKIDKDTFDATGAFDPILDVDSKLFIDPALLEKTQCKEFLYARNEMEHYFSGIIALLKHSQVKGDRFWKRADKELCFTEIRGTCLGYSEKSIDGNGIGPNLRNQILRSIKQLIVSGADDPILFELLGAFEEKIGCDRISDLIAFRLIDRICSYTKRITEICNFKGPYISRYNYSLPKSPCSSEAVLLIPKEILHPLPLAKRFEDITHVCRENERVRENVNKWFDFTNGTKPQKNEIFYHLRNDPEFRKAYLDSYKNAPAVPYDFTKDTTGEITWYEKGKKIAAKYPCFITNKQSLKAIVTEITRHFKTLIEDNGIWEILYQDDRQTPRTERISQHLFAAIAKSYCEANNIDISPEVNSGNGPVDFKFSSGYLNKILVELKLSKNPQLQHCIDKQIPIYMKQENTDMAIYLLINVGNDKKVKSFKNQYLALDKNIRDKISLIIVDAKPKDSASKA